MEKNMFGLLSVTAPAMTGKQNGVAAKFKTKKKKKKNFRKLLFIFIATGWTVRGSNPGGGRDFPHPSRPALGPTQPPVQWVPGLFRGVKRLGRGADHPPLI